MLLDTFQTIFANIHYTRKVCFHLMAYFYKIRKKTKQIPDKDFDVNGIALKLSTSFLKPRVSGFQLKLRPTLEKRNAGRDKNIFVYPLEYQLVQISRTPQKFTFQVFAFITTPWTPKNAAQ